MGLAWALVVVTVVIIIVMLMRQNAENNLQLPKLDNTSMIVNPRMRMNSSEMDALVISILEKVGVGKTLYVSSLLSDENIRINFNKIGWFMNSFDFLKKHNLDDRYIVHVDFYDKEKRIGDIEDITITINPSPNPKRIVSDEDYIYKSSDIKYIQIKGLAYQNLREKHLGKFYGYVKTRKNSIYDPYSIEIYNMKEELLGYAPKGSVYLFNTLELIGGTEQAWGFIRSEHHKYNDTDELRGMVYIPIKCSPQKIDKAKAEFKNKIIRRRINV